MSWVIIFAVAHQCDGQLKKKENFINRVIK